MQRYTIYRTPNLPNTYLVLAAHDAPRKIVPFNLLYLVGEPEATKAGISPSYFPFAAGSRKIITDCVEQHGYCFYRWPGRILGGGTGRRARGHPGLRGRHSRSPARRLTGRPGAASPSRPSDQMPATTAPAAAACAPKMQAPRCPGRPYLFLDEISPAISRHAPEY